MLQTRPLRTRRLAPNAKHNPKPYSLQIFKTFANSSSRRFRARRVQKWLHLASDSSAEKQQIKSHRSNPPGKLAPQRHQLPHASLARLVRPRRPHFAASQFPERRRSLGARSRFFLCTVQWRRRG